MLVGFVKKKARKFKAIIRTKKDKRKIIGKRQITMLRRGISINT